MDHQTLHTQYEALKESTTKRLKTFNAMIRQERETKPVNLEKMNYLKGKKKQVMGSLNTIHLALQRKDLTVMSLEQVKQDYLTFQTVF